MALRAAAALTLGALLLALSASDSHAAGFFDLFNLRPKNQTTTITPLITTVEKRVDEKNSEGAHGSDISDSNRGSEININDKDDGNGTANSEKRNEGNGVRNGNLTVVEENTYGESGSGKAIDKNVTINGRSNGEDSNAGKGSNGSRRGGSGGDEDRKNGNTSSVHRGNGSGHRRGGGNGNEDRNNGRNSSNANRGNDYGDRRGSTGDEDRTNGSSRIGNGSGNRTSNGSYRSSNGSNRSSNGGSRSSTGSSKSRNGNGGNGSGGGGGGRSRISGSSAPSKVNLPLHELKPTIEVSVFPPGVSSPAMRSHSRGNGERSSSTNGRANATIMVSVPPVPIKAEQKTEEPKFVPCFVPVFGFFCPSCFVEHPCKRKITNEPNLLNLPIPVANRDEGEVRTAQRSTMARQKNGEFVTTVDVPLLPAEVTDDFNSDNSPDSTNSFHTDGATPPVLWGPYPTELNLAQFPYPGLGQHQLPYEDYGSSWRQRRHLIQPRSVWQTMTPLPYHPWNPYGPYGGPPSPPAPFVSPWSRWRRQHIPPEPNELPGDLDALGGPPDPWFDSGYFAPAPYSGWYSYSYSPAMYSYSVPYSIPWASYATPWSFSGPMPVPSPSFRYHKLFRQGPPPPPPPQPLPDADSDSGNSSAPSEAPAEERNDNAQEARVKDSTQRQHHHLHQQHQQQMQPYFHPTRHHRHRHPPSWQYPQVQPPHPFYPPRLQLGPWIGPGIAPPPLPPPPPPPPQPPKKDGADKVD